MILPRESVLHAVEFLDKRVEDFLRSGGEPVSTAVVLGSGLGRLADSLRDARAVPYAEIPGFVGASAPGHAGRLVFGRLGNNKLAVMQGRLHFYEGHTMERSHTGS
jgi:purine-nucleoside phosphorylase